MHDAGAGVERDVFAQIDRGVAVVERVAEANQREFLTKRRCQRGAGESPAGEARLDRRWERGKKFLRFGCSGYAPASAIFVG